MSKNARALTTLLSQYGHGRDSIVIRTLYVDMLLDLDAAMVLSECEFWTGKGRDKSGYFYRTHEQWLERTRLSRYKIDKAIEKIEGALPGVLERKVKKVGGFPVAHYRVNFDLLTEHVVRYLDRLEGDTEPTPAPAQARQVDKVPLFEVPAKAPEKKEPRVNPDILELEEYIQEQTGLQLSWAKPKQAQLLWRSPVKRMITIVDGDTKKARSILREAITKMRTDGLTISSPASLEKVYSAIYAERSTRERERRNAYTAGELGDFVSK